MNDWHRPAGSAVVDGDPVVITPHAAGWTYSGLRVVRLARGEERRLHTGESEVAVLPLSGGGLTVDVDGEHFRLAGRDSVFARVTDWAYLPLQTDALLTGRGDRDVEVALASAVATRRFPPAYVAAADVPIELRGAGPATRQVTNFMAPGVFDGADKLMCVELLTPDGNWSSYPPHRHDGSTGCPVNNEEIYYFRVGRLGSTKYAPEGFAQHRTYADAEPPREAVDVNISVHDGDVFLIPYGYHGPCVAAPGYPLYYLNVLAGPGGERTMAFCDDPTHHWVRDAWERQALDPRCPMTTAAGVRQP
jgi:5-deoxy-glucuronate isomerase